MSINPKPINPTQINDVRHVHDLSCPIPQAPIYWRADGGYQTPPPPPPPPPEPPAPVVYQPVMFCYPQYGVPQWYCQPYQQPYQQCQQPPAYQVIYPPGQCGRYVEGPIPIAGLRSPPPAYAAVSPPPPSPPALPTPPVVPGKGHKGEKEKEDGKKDEKEGGSKGSSKGSSKSDSSKSDSAKPEGANGERKKEKENPYAPPSLPYHANYLFDKDHTMIHIFSKAAPVWTEKYRKQHLKFKMFKVSINFTVKMVIENVLRKRGDECGEWAVTEVVERGGGVWDKGSSVEYTSDRAKGTLKSMGWSQKRGGVLPPVWLVVHKVDFMDG